MSVTNEQLAEWARLEREAKSGPWTWVTPPPSGPHEALKLARMVAGDGSEVCDFGAVDLPEDTAGNEPSDADKAFISAARTALPALVEEVRRLRRALGL